MSNNSNGIVWIPDGEPNFYTLLKDGRWFAKVQLNGEMTSQSQEEFMSRMFPQLQREPEHKS